MKRPTITSRSPLAARAAVSPAGSSRQDRKPIRAVTVQACAAPRNRRTLPPPAGGTIKCGRIALMESHRPAQARGRPQRKPPCHWPPEPCSAARIRGITAVTPYITAKNRRLDSQKIGISGLNLFSPADFLPNPPAYTACLIFRLRADNRPPGRHSRSSGNVLNKPPCLRQAS